MATVDRLPDATSLAVEAAQWTVQLRDGSRLQVLAHAWAVDGDDCVFSLLFKGEPHFEVESLRLPLALLAEDFDRGVR